MELFYSKEIADGRCRLGAEEAAHCVKVLRHRPGERIRVIDGEGGMYLCEIVEASPKAVEALVLERHTDWGRHPYELVIGVCPTKNNERFEWFVEKATELGVDEIVPLIGERSERKVYKTERAVKIVQAAAKQSLKAKFPKVREAVRVADFIKECQEVEAVKLIAWCFEGVAPRRAVTEVVEKGRKVIVLIGPEGDFSPAEGQLAVDCGFAPVQLGGSRLRTETAALTAVNAVYLKNL